MSSHHHELIEHLLAICQEGDGTVRADAYTFAHIAGLLERARQGSADAEYVVSPLLELLATGVTSRPPCFVCDKVIRSPGGVVIVQALNVAAEHAVGGIICAKCIAMRPARLQAALSKVLRTAGFKPGPGPGGRNVHLDGGRA
jgi:hypothetical protein